MVPDVSEWKVGDRVDVSGQKGTIRFIGPVIGTTNDWLGIEWDDPDRGKHNGTHQGIAYFSTRLATSGSFVRPSKVTQRMSVIDAITRRYGLVDDNAGVDLSSLAQVQKDIRAKFIEVVGAEKINRKQSEFQNLTVVSLRDNMISYAGHANELSELCPCIQEMDLSKNLINSWTAASEIAKQLPNLQLLNLSENLMEIDESTISEGFAGLQHIILARNNLTWNQIVHCCRSLPSLRILQVPFNNVTSLHLPDSLFSLIESIDLEGNCLGCWSQVNKLGVLTHLKTLNVSACSLTNISFPVPFGSEDSSLFPALEHLLISENHINYWSSISELDKLKSLQHLKFTKNPILEVEDSGTNFQLILARIKRLKTLNGQTISWEERRGAELDFIKRHGLEYLQLNSHVDRVKFHQLYPCYERLVQSYGPPEASELRTLPASLKSSLIYIELKCADDPDRIVKKKVPLNMTVQKLTGLVQRIFNTGLSVPKLFYIHSKAENREIELDNELKDLNFFSVEDGSSIIVRW